MARMQWTVKPFVGQTARLRLIDFSSVNHVNFDNFSGEVIKCGGTFLCILKEHYNVAKTK